MELLGGYRRELAFYRHVAGRAPMATPQVYAARMAEDSVDFVLLLEDLQALGQRRPPRRPAMDQARLCIDQLAGLHAWSCDSANSAVLEDFPSLDTPIARDLLLPAFAPGWQIYRDHCNGSVPASVARFAESFAERAVEALPALTERDMLLHGDIRADNLFFDGDRMKVVDFQFAARGCGAADIAYLVTQGLPSRTRHGHDEALVRALPGPSGRSGGRRLRVRRRVAALPLRRGLSDGAARHHAQRLGCVAGAVPSALSDADRPGGRRHRRDRRTGGVLVTRIRP